ncbi:hypothetical protein AGMMS49982_22980 [Bacteroidia bacterium]|nr:hypothetical protein AGMMS49982_22980 [Bacteroidia bacterium]
MATPIKPTPILTGRDSIRFAKAMENVQQISPEEREEQRQAYEWFKNAAQFPIYPK